MIAGKAYNSTYFDIPLYYGISPVLWQGNCGATTACTEQKAGLTAPKVSSVFYCSIK